MDNEVKKRFDDLNVYITELETKIKNGTKFNIAVYGIIIVTFIIYAVVIPKEVRHYTSPEEGPMTLVSLIEGIIPSDEDLIAKAKEEIPKLIDDGLDNLVKHIPTGQQIFMDGMTVMTHDMVELIEKEIAPTFKSYLLESIHKLKTENPDMTGPEAKTLFNDSARIHLKESLTNIVTDGKIRLMQNKLKMRQFRKSDSELSNAQLAEKRILLSFIRLCDDEKYRAQLSNALINALERTYNSSAFK